MTLKTMARRTNVELLILGAGWTSTFLILLLTEQNISHAATSTTGREGTYKFKFEHDESDEGQKQYEALPTAQTILITFPLKGKHEASRLVDSYEKAHGRAESARFQFIQLGSSGIFTIPDQEMWVTRRSKYDTKNERALAEDELLAMGGCVLNLSGLWGGARDPKHWIDRVADTKEKLKGKTSLHLVHGLDVARAVIAVHRLFSKAAGQRWLVTDLFVYDWWSLILGWAGQLDAENDDSAREMSQIKWIGELMVEAEVRALPRSMGQLGRCYDAREFWTAFELMPIRART
ncbi:hypothetical protein BJ875DRAFT_463991 [Amylocarpus encephaloides]|uniref:Uncharacterized protein n=1 Tax=Amylocarpus encephaloides TaxID=45428 RepID=A0A9P8C4U1_9HELO|nr:hypothetical protein BJ875DRAFT_463991 [Amylocarpus encephaloides]